MKVIMTPHECQSETWQKLMKHYKPMLAEKRARLEVPNILESERIALCWQIDTIKKLIALGEPDAKNVAGAG
jgi:hypothetical protein